MRPPLLPCRKQHSDDVRSYVVTPVLRSPDDMPCKMDIQFHQVEPKTAHVSTIHHILNRSYRSVDKILSHAYRVQEPHLTLFLIETAIQIYNPLPPSIIVSAHTEFLRAQMLFSSGHLRKPIFLAKARLASYSSAAFLFCSAGGL